MLCFHQFPPSAFQAPPSSSELVAQLGVEQLKVNLTPGIATCENLHSSICIQKVNNGCLAETWLLQGHLGVDELGPPSGELTLHGTA